MIRIHNVETGEIIDRDLTPDEIAENATRDAAAELILSEREQKRIARQALLERLGITEEEAKLLLG